MATKSYDHAVIYNGKFYPSNTPITVENEGLDVETEVTTPEQPNEGAEEKAVKANADKRTSGKSKTANTAD